MARTSTDPLADARDRAFQHYADLAHKALHATGSQAERLWDQAFIAHEAWVNLGGNND